MVRTSEEYAKLYVREWLLPYAQGGLPQEYAIIFAGTVLVALSKAPKPGFRPVGNPDWTRKLVCHILLKPLKPALATHFTDKHENYKQYAVRVKAGAEKMYHHVSLLLDIIPDPSTPLENIDQTENVTALLQMDLVNAYNEVARQALFDALDGRSSRSWPGTTLRPGTQLSQHPAHILVGLLADVYGTAASLIHRGQDRKARELLSKAGFHQGDVLGSLAYALATYDFFAEAFKHDKGVAGFS